MANSKESLNVAQNQVISQEDAQAQLLEQAQMAIQQNQALRQRVVELSNQATFMRLECLFKVLESNQNFTPEQLTKVSKAIMESLELEKKSEE